jgi:O-antigen/teichoic acid export membrane protein
VPVPIVLVRNLKCPIPLNGLFSYIDATFYSVRTSAKADSSGKRDDALISNQITRNFLSLFLSNVVGQVFILLAFVHIASLSGPEGFGKFAFAQVVGLYFLYLADFGLQTLGTRSIAQERGDISGHVRDITALRILLALGSFVLLVVFVLVLPKSSDVKTLILLFGLALFPTAVLFEWVFQGIEEMEYVGLGRVLKGIVFAGLVFLFMRGKDQLSYAAVFYVAGIVVATFVLLLAYVRKFGAFWGKIKGSALKGLMKSAAPLAAGFFIAQINYNFGTVALGLFMSDEMVGLFSAPYKIILFIWAFAVVAASNAVLPLLARSYKSSVTEFGNSLKKLFRIFVLLAVPMGIGGTILASRIMGFLYAPEFQKAAIVFQISIWSVVFVIYRVVFENALIASSSQRSYIVGYVLAGALTIVGNCLLVPVLGLIAPSIVGIISEFVLLSYFVVSCKYVRPLHIVKMTVKPLLAGLLMGLALVLFPLSLFLSLVLGTIVYAAFLLIFRCLTVEEVAGYVHSLVR